MRELSIVASLLFLPALVGGCGDDAPAVAPSPPAEQGIFISSQDCAAANKLTLAQCEEAVEHAVARHQAEAPAFEDNLQCDAAYGSERCERDVHGRFRPQIQAFLVTLAVPPQGIPLYPPTNSLVGFESSSRHPVDARDVTLQVSSAALTLANENGKLAPPRTVDDSAALAEAASHIH